MTTDRDADRRTLRHTAPSDRSRGRLLWLCPLVGLIAGAVILGLFGVKLWTAITPAHLITWPLLVLLLCVVMHIFMHRGHGDHGSNRGDRNRGDNGK